MERQTRKCVICGKKYEPNAPHQKYCSQNCNTKAYCIRYPDRTKESRKKYRDANLKKINSDHRKWYAKNSEKQAEYRRTKMKDYHRKWWADRREKDIDFKLKNNIRNRIRSALKGVKKSAKTEELLGCTISEFKKHIESKFQSGMTWKNHGPKGWHIDHIKPLSKFDLTNEKQLKKACHYTNTQPMWWKDNLQKGDK